MPTYTVQVEGMWCARRVAGGRERQLNCRVRRERVDTADRHQVLRSARAAHDLQQDRNGRGHETCVVDEEVRAILHVKDIDQSAFMS